MKNWDGTYTMTFEYYDGSKEIQNYNPLMNSVSVVQYMEDGRKLVQSHDGNGSYQFTEFDANGDLIASGRDDGHWRETTFFLPDGVAYESYDGIADTTTTRTHYTDGRSREETTDNVTRVVNYVARGADGKIQEEGTRSPLGNATIKMYLPDGRFATMIYENGNIVSGEMTYPIGPWGQAFRDIGSRLSANASSVWDFVAGGGPKAPVKGATEVSVGTHKYRVETALGTTSGEVLSGNGIIAGAGGNDVLVGGSRSDMLVGGSGDDILNGGAGADHLIGGSGAGDMAAYNGLNGQGVVVSLANSADNTGEAAGDTYDGVENVAGTAYNDVLIGDTGNNMLYGQGSDDILRGGAGADVLDGGAGFDWASYLEASAGVVVDLTAPAANAGEARGDIHCNIEALQGSNHADAFLGDAIGNALFGLGGADWLVGRGGNDHLDGGEGNDTLNGGVGADVLEGGVGFDWAVYTDATAGVRVDLLNRALNSGEAAGDTLINIEALQGSNYADQLAGTDGDNWLWALAGNDVLHGRGGNDVLDGGAGDDILNGGAGADTLHGSGGFDWASYIDATAGVVVNLSDRSKNTGEAGGDVYYGIRGVQGSNHGDSLTADTSTQGNALSGLGGNDVLVGRKGNDHLDGGTGDDILQGNEGADVLNGGADFDWASYIYATSGVVASLLNSAANTGEAAGDTYIGIEALQGSAYNDVLTAADYLAGNALVGLGGNDVLNGRIGNDYLEGGEGHDTLWGQDGADVLTGGSGSDTLSGGAGSDQLTGGVGSDLFRFDTALGTGGIDRIADFTVGEDKIALSRSVFAGLDLGGYASLSGTSSSVAASVFTVGRGATSLEHRLIYNSGTGALFYDADGIGGAAQVQFATLAPNLLLNQNSFVMI
ncbi:calcium-binding protein [Microvirga lupini]|uniref:calcium-binding protein n=1 Tax=Microvirga lupini TaxID=420324 RepID=UPI0031B5D163